MRPIDDLGVRLEPPTLRRANVARPRLLERVRERFSARVTVIVAPAGFGKTTLLAQAIADNRVAPRGTDVWLTCRSDDAAGSSIVRGLCRAIGVAAPSAVGDAMDALVETVWHRSPDEVVFVIDDVHEIVARSSGAGVLAELVSAAPRNGHFVFAGRRAPPVDLARLEVEGQLVRVPESDLLFSAEELAAFAAARDVPIEWLAGWGGWPALTELAASSVSGDEYLWQQVLERIPPDRRRALALLAHVGPVDDALATSVLERETDVAELTAGLPLVAATGGGSHQIHPLWRPHLAAVVSEAEIAEARRRAGTEIARSGDMIAAVRLLTEASAWDEVTRVIAEVLGVPDPRLPVDVLETWSDRLPDVLRAGPLGLLLRVASGDGSSDPVGTSAMLEDAAEAFRRQGHLAGEVACLAQLARFGWVFERPDLMLRLAGRLFDLEARGYDEARSLASLVRAAMWHPQGMWEEGLAELDALPPRSLSAPWRHVAEWLKAMLLCHLGRPAEALAAADRARGESSPLPAPAAEGLRLQALWLLGRIDEVLAEIPAFNDRVTTTGFDDLAAYSLAVAAAVTALTGRSDAAAEHLAQARRLAPSSPPVPMVDAIVAAAEAALAVATADEPRAVRLLEGHLARSPTLGVGVAALNQFTMLPLWYVLVPESRATWDGLALGPCFVTARAIARDLVAVRETGRLPASTASLPPPDLVRSLLPVPWAVELALAHVAARHQAGWTLLEAHWPAAQAEVRRHAGDGKDLLRRPARTALARLPVPPPGRLELSLLGPVELRRDGELVDGPDWRRERVRSLLAHLVLHRTVRRERVAADLWPTLDAESQSHNLRVNLVHLLRVLEPDRAERDASFLVRSHGENLVVHPDEWLRTDLWQFDQLWQRASEADAKGSPSAALDALQQAVALWRGDPAELANNEWALPEVEERRLVFVRMVTRAGELLLARGEADAARHMGEQALLVDPWCESAYRLVVVAHVAMGELRSAGSVLERYRIALGELGLPTAAASDQLERLTRLVHERSNPS